MTSEFQDGSSTSLISNSSYQPQINDTFESHQEFVDKIKNYAHELHFTIRLGKVEYKKSNSKKPEESSSINMERRIRKRTLLCSRAGHTELKECGSEDEISSKGRGKTSQRCDCPFYVRASLNSTNGLWYIINMNLIHNHHMVDENHQHFMSNERSIPDDVKQRIEILRRAGVDVTTIRSILKEEFGNCVTWVYNDIYNFIYKLEGSGINKRELDAEEFVKLLEQFKNDNKEFLYFTDINKDTNRLERVIWMFPEQRMNYSRFHDIVVFDNTYKTNRFKMPFGIFTGVNNYGHSVCFAGALMVDETEDNFLWVFSKFLEMVNQHAPLVILTDDDRAMANAYVKILKPMGTKHRLCQWHLMKNVMKNLCSKLGSNWSAFIKDLYKCLEEMDIQNFLLQWDALKASYPSATTYLLRMEKTKEKWAGCYNHDTFMADMISTQRGESMNNMMKGYLDASTSLVKFINAFQSALEAQNENTEFRIYKQNNFNILYKTTSPLERQAASILTTFSLKKTQEQLMQSFMYKCEEISK
jgi:hypothetical protein